MIFPAVLTAMFLFPGLQDETNSWVERVQPAIEEAQRAGTPQAYIDALEAAWRADDWAAALRLAEEAEAKFAGSTELAGFTARALWRAGRIEAAERVAQRIPADSRDLAALTTLVTIHLARGEGDQANAVADRLMALPRSAMGLFAIIAARSAQQRNEGLVELIREADRLTKKENGYPEVHFAELLDGAAEFFEHVGPQRLNRVTRHGTTPMPVLPLIRLPYVDMHINGHGPFRVIIDTGGSITLSLDKEVAQQIGLEPFSTADVRGVIGTEESGQALVNELRMGDIRMERVMTRIFRVRQATAFSADGILGTGVFTDARMTLDFAGGQLVIEPSSSAPAKGMLTPVRLVGDAKLVSEVKINGQPATALLDSGADAAALAPSAMKRLFPDRDFRTVSGIGAVGVGEGGALSVSMGPGVTFLFAERVYENFGGIGLDVMDTLLSPLLGVQCDVLVGMAVMRDMQRLTVDFPKVQMWVDWLPKQ